jgi:ABC-type dipeptide/oligopeptide/nickel transport system ATPase component
VVDGVDLDVQPGEMLGLVGESGSGKSMTLRSILRLIRPPGRVTGQVLWKGRDLVPLREAEMRAIRGREIGMIFQEPMTALNPVLSVGAQILENLVAHTDLGRAGGGVARPRRHSGRRAARERLSAPVFRRHAPARDDRDRAGLQPDAAAGR